MMPAPLHSQAPPPIDCAYDECALRVEQGFFGQDLVRGLEEVEVSGLGLYVGGLDDVFAGSPIAQDLAASYRSRHNAGSVLTLIGVVVMTVSLYATDDWVDSGSWAGVLGGSVVALTGALVEASGRDRLHRAVWEYNRALAR
jgi:hypothetical protein